MNTRSPTGSAHYLRSVEALRDAAANAATGEGPFRAGWARVRIDTPPDGPLAGYATRDGAPNQGVADPAYVRAIAIGAGEHRVVIVTADLLAIDRDVVRSALDSINPQLCLRSDQVFFSVTHTHSGPGGYVGGLYETAFGSYDSRAFDAVAKAHARAIEAAVAAMVPATIAVSRVRAPGLCRNRVEKDGPVDDALWLMRFESLPQGGTKAGTKAAALWSYDCHAVTRTDEQFEISADFPGQVAAAYEGRDLDVLAYFAGGVGSVNPQKPAIAEPLIAAVGAALARSATEPASQGRLTSAQGNFEFGQISYAMGDSLMVLPLLAQAVLQPPRLGFGAVDIGPASIVFVPAEMSSELATRLRKSADRQGKLLAVASLNGLGYAGYVVAKRVHDLPPERLAELGRYETRTMSFLGPWGGELMANLGWQLVSRLWVTP